MIGRRTRLRLVDDRYGAGAQLRNDSTGCYKPEAFKVNRFHLIKHPGNECRFCRYLNSTSEQIGVNTPWLVSGNYSAFVSVGSLVLGWSLIIPKAHTLNLSAEYNRAEFWKFTDNAAKVIADRFGPFCIFEHGAFDQASETGCGTGHAHLHMVPLPFSLIDEAAKFDTDMKWEDCLATDICKKTQNSEYLYVADEYRGSLTFGKLCLLKSQTSQFFRKVIAKKIGNPSSYDYKTSPMLEITNKSHKILSSRKHPTKKNPSFV